MKTITFHNKDYTITIRAKDIVATAKDKDEFNIYLRGISEPFTLTNIDHFDELESIIWEDTNEST